MADINLKLLRTFESVARLRSFTRAAAELQRAQATVSSQFIVLAAQLGVLLLERNSRHVALKGVPLSPVAARLARHIRSSLARQAAAARPIPSEPMELTL